MQAHPSENSEDGLSEHPTSYHVSSQVSLRDEDLFITRPGMQVGDQVCILLGCDHSLNLRHVNNNSYIIVGSCFVAGLEDSRHILDPLPEHFLTRIDSVHGRSVQVFNDQRAPRRWYNYHGYPG
ncbi:hypothetical protein BDV96DRAFT_308219 [Lophiotrema nucula]|uniref:Uncharacterized protein n=1 Tax=Lophiotrema nucula TaxID=690887 RepID=A0A6A5YM35_9PLEO|nr:hypothetical protein BDV96DRAFT_308219 [Lophiotrema nucula]